MMRGLVFARAVALLLAVLTIGCTMDDVSQFVDLGEVVQLVDEARTKAKIAVLANPKVDSAKGATQLKRALEVCRDEQTDAVVILGELTHDGYMTQYREFATLWKTIMKDCDCRLIAVRGFNEDLELKPGADRALAEIATVMPPEGGEFEVGGFRFFASYAKNEAKKPGLLGFCFMERLVLTDEFSFSPRSELSIACGSLTGVTVPSYYERGKSAQIASQGLFVKVYSSSVDVLRLDFAKTSPVRRKKGETVKRTLTGKTYAEEVAAPWVIERREDGSCFAPDAEKAVPRFWDDTRLQVYRGDDGTHRAYTVRFPQVLAKYTGVRAYSYDIVCGNVVRHVLPPNFHESEDRVDRPVDYLFLESDLEGVPGETLEFAVTPVSSLGEKGQPIRASVRR